MADTTPAPATGAATAGSIDPDAALPPGQDFALLRETGVAAVQALSGGVWTDYNEHDPGVTILEQLCYALTELSYRAAFPVADLLTPAPGARIDTRRQALYGALAILPCNPVTPDDLRRLVVDRVPEVANIWFEPWRGDTPATAIDGLYRALVYLPDPDPCRCDGHAGAAGLLERVARVYARHRAVGEDLGTVLLLEPERTVLDAEVAIGCARTPEATLAGILFAVEALLAPRLRREPLSALLDAGLPPDAVFEGPAVRNGFVSDDQLQPKARCVTVEAIAATVAGCDNVLALSDLSVVTGRTGGETRRWVMAETIPIADDRILRLDAQPDSGGRWSIRLLRDGAECRPDPAGVQRELTALWAEWQRLWPLGPAYAGAFGVPAGRWRDLASYTSVQTQFPGTYGIGLNGVPPDHPPLRRAQAKQLKGYLAVFEQLLCDGFAQVAGIRDLFAVRDAPEATYVWQSLRAAIPDSATVLPPYYEAGMAALVAVMDPAAGRRARFLDLLLALYAADGGDGAAACACGTGGRPAAGNDDRARLLRRMVTATRDRGQGLDRLAVPLPRRNGGFERLCRLLLGMDVAEGAPLVEALADAGLDLVPDGDADPLEAPVTGLSDAAVAAGLPAALIPPPSDAAPVAVPARVRRVSPAFLAAAGDLANHRVAASAADGGAVLVVTGGGTGRPARSWWPVGRYPTASAAAGAARGLAVLFGGLAWRCRQLYVVEHTLLRWALDAAPPQGGEAGFVYGFTLTVVVCAPGEAPDAVRATLRASAPAGAVVGALFIGPVALVAFELVYWNWRLALASGDAARRAAACVQLRDRLQELGAPAGP